ncbi:hypothetical protein HCB06_12780 [Listeria booriae]|uniref:Core-binding (CB) domain-containing protein n=1 Tax=Listeria booriae TaxID=1552123 RepID=A0A7X0YNJ0_9LIST|nr:hypothetical protein [Listeria booriae]
MKSGHFNSDDSILFIEYAEKWLANYAINNKESTVRPRKIEQKWIVKQFGYIKIKQITSIMYQDFLDELNKIYATNTISGTHSVARMIFKKAYQDNIIDRDPTLYAILPKKLETAQDIQNKISNPISKNIEVEKIKLILSTAKEQGLENDYETFSLLASTGIRVGELIALKYDDLKSQNGKYEIEEKYTPHSFRHSYATLLEELQLPQVYTKTAWTLLIRDDTKHIYSYNRQHKERSFCQGE